jgi:hypothetical protein
MNDRLPTIYHGVSDSEEDTRIVNDAIQDMVARLSAVPERLALGVLCSVMVSACCAQDDPGAIFQVIGANVALAINNVLAEPAGTA